MLTNSSSPEPTQEKLAAPPPWLDSAVVPALAGLVLVFASTTEVLNAEDRLEAENFEFVLIPVPKEVNPNCGLALCIPEESAPAIDQALARAGLSPVAVYRRLDGEYHPLSAEKGLWARSAGLAAAP